MQNTKGIEYDKIIIEIQEFPLDVQSKKDLLASGWDSICTVRRILTQNESRIPSRYKSVFTKHILFNLTEYEGVVFIDSDAFVIGDISDLFYFHKIIDYENYYFAVGPDYLGKSEYSKLYFNTGVFTVRPNSSEFNRLHKLGKGNLSHINLDYPQNFLNYYYHKKWINIGFKYNFLGFSILDFKFSEEFIRSKCLIIHFAGAKPWACPKEIEFLCNLWNKIEV
ncbi:unnamed protein product [Brachionus calyciflorus]|uniref:glycogenin glucosyltransferase n=1 Tax=Brachionus calyciflorus TaxID=104777 RepID=A0A814GLY8_9BILA|nr:unnamed protein product [Brachionus calyciflorus]